MIRVHSPRKLSGFAVLLHSILVFFAVQFSLISVVIAADGKSAMGAPPATEHSPSPPLRERVGERGADSFKTDVQPVLTEFCGKCHGAEKPKGGVSFSKFNSLDEVLRDPKTWEKAARQLRDREMPPEGKPQPTPDQRDQLVTWIERTLNQVDFTRLPKDPGLIVLHRLNRVEYNNTVRDLFGVTNRPADKFPGDAGGGGGFDNNASTLYVPPLLMEKYFNAADEVIAAVPSQKILLTSPGWFVSERSAARKTITYYSARAFRHPVSAAENEGLIAVYDRSRNSGLNHEDSIRMALKVLLVSPQFLFRVEHEQNTPEPYRISDYELASRLSYFLWSSMPDDELMRLANWNKLSDQKTLAQQVRRMLRDPKAGAFAENFTSQWLGTRRLETSVQPDQGKFPTYTPSLRRAMEMEPILFVQALLREDRSILDLIDSDYAFVNPELARHYGIDALVNSASTPTTLRSSRGNETPETLESIPGEDQFQRVSLKGHERGGVLGMGGVLTLTSYPGRTSPVLRGKWVMEEILGTPPPPPPPMVKSLDQNDKPREGLSFRQRLEQHRIKPECASCHKRMDPLGFGLENFDAIGRWRTEIGGQPLDSSGVLVSGEKFEGPAQLKQILISHKKDQFLRNFTEKMLAYALGRGVEYYDTPVIKHITNAVANDNYRVSSLILEIVNSYPFQYRRGTALNKSKS